MNFYYIFKNDKVILSLSSHPPPMAWNVIEYVILFYEQSCTFKFLLYGFFKNLLSLFFVNRMRQLLQNNPFTKKFDISFKMPHQNPSVIRTVGFPTLFYDFLINFACWPLCLIILSLLSNLRVCLFSQLSGEKQN